jgi:large-conductance mechanosensitive channel
MNGETKLNIWDTDECNEIVGTDGSQFPPHLMDKDKELKIFIKSFCRTLKLKFDREVTVLNGIPAWKYKAVPNEFASSLRNPENKCYCDAETNKRCPPDGVFDSSKCVDGIPLFISYPHFLEGDASLFEHIEGLNPDPQKHETFAEIHPRMAFPIGGASRLQMNFRVTSREFRSFFTTYKWYTKLPKDFILPIFWFEVTAGEIPAEFQAIVFHTTQSANAMYLTIQFGSLVSSVISLLFLLSISYIYVKQLRKSIDKTENKDDVVTFNNINIYPNISSKTDEC